MEQGQGTPKTKAHIVPHPSSWTTRKRLADMLGVSLRTIDRRVAQGSILKKIQGNTCLYCLDTPSRQSDTGRQTERQAERQSDKQSDRATPATSDRATSDHHPRELRQQASIPSQQIQRSLDTLVETNHLQQKQIAQLQQQLHLSNLLNQQLQQLTDTQRRLLDLYRP